MKIRCFLNTLVILLILILPAAAADLALSKNSRLAIPTEFPILRGGSVIGQITLPMGTPVKILKRDAGRLFVESRLGNAWIEESSVVTGEVPETSPPSPVPIVASPATPSMELPPSKEGLPNPTTHNGRWIVSVTPSTDGGSWTIGVISDGYGTNGREWKS